LPWLYRGGCSVLVAYSWLIRQTDPQSMPGYVSDARLSEALIWGLGWAYARICWKCNSLACG
jgi:hypothetical protein